MIPEFPEFKKLELSDKKEVEKLTSKFLPYSDFNFVSMWSWDTKNEMRLSILNGNLVVQFTDYLTNKPFLSFIGENKVFETASELIEFSKKNYKVNTLRLIPEEIANILSKSGFQISTDADSHDYIYSIEDLSNMHNWSGHKSSKGIEKFLKLHSNYEIKISSLEKIPKNKYLDMFERWAKNKEIKNHSELNEYKAFKRFLEMKDKNVEIVSLYKNNELIGFTSYEILSSKYVISHFTKANIKYHNSINDILNWEEAKLLNSKGAKYYNWEQDLGIQGLRHSKKKYRPSHFLKKFIVTYKD